jgi:hypothetical protein
MRWNIFTFGNGLIFVENITRAAPILAAAVGEPTGSQLIKSASSSCTAITEQQIKSSTNRCDTRDLHFDTYNKISQPLMVNTDNSVDSNTELAALS